MPSQMSTQDQIDYLAVMLDDQEWPELAAWVRRESPLPEGYSLIESLNTMSWLARSLGLYDADNWVQAQYPDEE